MGFAEGVRVGFSCRCGLVSPFVEESGVIEGFEVVGVLAQEVLIGVERFVVASCGEQGARDIFAEGGFVGHPFGGLPREGERLVVLSARHHQLEELTGEKGMVGIVLGGGSQRFVEALDALFACVAEEGFCPFCVEGDVVVVDVEEVRVRLECGSEEGRSGGDVVGGRGESCFCVERSCADGRVVVFCQFVIDGEGAGRIAAHLEHFGEAEPCGEVVGVGVQMGAEPLDDALEDRSEEGEGTDRVEGGVPDECDLVEVSLHQGAEGFDGGFRLAGQGA